MIKTTIYTICYIDQDNDKRIRTQMKTVTDIRNKNAKKYMENSAVDNSKTD